MDWPATSGIFYWWSHDGSRFYYPDPRDKTQIRVKVVGSDLSADVDPIVFNAPTDLSELRVIPPVDPQNPVSDRYLVASTGSGIIAVDLASPAPNNWWWLATPAGTGLSSSSIRGPAFSPDGSAVAFGGIRTLTSTKGKKTTTYNYGVYVVPFSGGPITPVTEVTSTLAGNFVTVNNWNFP